MRSPPLQSTLPSDCASARIQDDPNARDEDDAESCKSVMTTFETGQSLSKPSKQMHSSDSDACTPSSFLYVHVLADAILGRAQKRSQPHRQILDGCHKLLAGSGGTGHSGQTGWEASAVGDCSAQYGIMGVVPQAEPLLSPAKGPAVHRVPGPPHQRISDAVTALVICIVVIFHALLGGVEYTSAATSFSGSIDATSDIWSLDTALDRREVEIADEAAEIADEATKPSAKVGSDILEPPVCAELNLVRDCRHAVGTPLAWCESYRDADALMCASGAVDGQCIRARAAVRCAARPPAPLDSLAVAAWAEVENVDGLADDDKSNNLCFLASRRIELPLCQWVGV